MASAFGGQRSIQLSYGCVLFAALAGAGDAFKPLQQRRMQLLPRMTANDHANVT